MKTLFQTISLLSLTAVILASCGGQDNSAEELPGISKGFKDSVSYAVGASLGSMVQQADFGDLNMEEVYKAIEDVLAEKELKVEMESANEVITKYLTKRQEAMSTVNKAEAEKFLEENKNQEGVIELESGLQYKIMEEGSDVMPAPEDTIEVHYVGTLTDGTQFDSSYDREEPATLALNRFIPGWVEGIQKIGEGGKIQLFIPADLAYQDQAMGEIKPGSTLIFEVELISVKRAE